MRDRHMCVHEHFEAKYGTREGTRTLNPEAADFKSAVYTIPPLSHKLYKNTLTKYFYMVD